MLFVQKVISILLFGLTLTSSGSVDPLVIQTKTGPVKGKTETSFNGKKVDAWYGIPYAQSPVGNLRFRHPRPIDRWHGIKDATKLPNSCWQISDNFFGDFEGATLWNANTPMSEDCLYISVIVPKPRPKKSAVLVWIYGGGFYSGTSTLEIYDYKTFASEQNIILVAIQYRVANLGFLYMGSADVPGNAGLFDQLMALQWINENIELFGGNKDNVTLFGESAGATSVSMHLVSPLTRDLFSQAIMQSGSATVPWGIVTREESVRRGLEMAKNVKCPHDQDNMEIVIDCLKNTSASVLVWNEPVLGLCGFPFVPIVDGSFFDEHPKKSVRTGNFKKTNILMGSCSEEGYWFILYYLTDIFKLEKEINIDRASFESSIRDLFPDFNELTLQALSYEYTNWRNPKDKEMLRDALDKMIGDYHFTCNVNEFAYNYALKGSNVYMYYYTQRSSQHLWPAWTGVLHGDEITFLFGHPLNKENNFTNAEKELSKRMMTYWANFAHNGDPNESNKGTWVTPKWPLHDVASRKYLTLSANSSEIGHGPRLKKCAFWSNFFPQIMKYTMKDKEDSTDTQKQCPKGSSSILSNSWFIFTTVAALIPQFWKSSVILP